MATRFSMTRKLRNEPKDGTRVDAGEPPCNKITKRTQALRKRRNFWVAAPSQIVMRVLAFTAILINAAAQTPQFEVASIKLSPPPDERGYSVWCRGGPLGKDDPGLYRCENLNISALITTAFDLKPYQFHLPDYLGDMRVNLSAKVPEGATKEQFRLMVQGLLKERFQFAYHWEKKEMSGYDLLPAKGGPKFKESKPGPDAENAPVGKLEKDAEGYPILPPGRSMMAAMAGGYSTQQWVNEPLERLIWMLEQRLGAPVDNATGLTGKYDMTLRWIQDGGRVADEIHGPPLLQALQEQLGLRVQKKQTAAAVLVIDHMEKKPTQN
jgi:uncharacterized protein (TIGR03435 family)